MNRQNVRIFVLVKCFQDWLFPVIRYSNSFNAVEDFDSRSIPFTIPSNTVQTNQSVEIVVVDDDLLEPQQEGFRLLLVVDELRTPLSQVRFNANQLALFRIDDYTDSESYLACTTITSHILFT